MDANAAQRVGEIVIVGENRAAVAVAAQRLCGKETGRGGIGQRAQPAAMAGRAKSLRGVVQHKEAFGTRQISDPLMIGALAEQIDRDYGLWLEAKLPCGRNPALQRRAGHVECRFVDVDNNGVAPVRATGEAVAQNVNDGQKTASPAPTPIAISTMTSASVPFAQVMTCLAPQ